MKQILNQEGYFVLTVKRNQPQSYEEIMKYFNELSEEYKRMKDNIILLREITLDHLLHGIESEPKMC